MLRPDDLTDFHPIKIDDKPIFDALFKEFSPEISEYTFTNLFMWREYYHFRWAKIDRQLIVLGFKDPNIISIFPPVGSDLKHAMQYLRQLRQTIQPNQEKLITFQLERLPESYLEPLKQLFPTLQPIEDRDNFDYVYATLTLRDLPGGDLFNERKKLNKFKKTNIWEYQPLSAQNLDACVKLQAEWCGIRACEDDPALASENNAIKEILQFSNVLSFSGGVLLVDGKVQAYTLGEPLNPTTMVTHVEKANAEIYGLYQGINQQFAEISVKGFEFINREQDLGIPSLRRAKENYHPVKMIKKYKITFS